MPKPAPEKSDEVAELDPDLRPEEQSYVNHYLKYADVLLGEPGADETVNRPWRGNNVIELPRMQEPEESEPDKDCETADKVA